MSLIWFNLFKGDSSWDIFRCTKWRWCIAAVVFLQHGSGLVCWSFFFLSVESKQPLQLPPCNAVSPQPTPTVDSQQVSDFGCLISSFSLFTAYFFLFLKTFVLVQDNHTCIPDFLSSFSTDKKRRFPSIQRDSPSATESSGLLQTPQPRVRGSRAEGPAHSAVQPPQNPQQISRCPASFHSWCLPDPPWPGGLSKGRGVSSISRDILGLCVLLGTVTPLSAILHRAARQETRNLPWESDLAELLCDLHKAVYVWPYWSRQ